MIIVVTSLEKNEITGRSELVVSHGIDEFTGNVVIMQNSHPEQIGAVYCTEMNEWVLQDPSISDEIKVSDQNSG